MWNWLKNNFRWFVSGIVVAISLVAMTSQVQRFFIADKLKIGFYETSVEAERQLRDVQKIQENLKVLTKFLDVTPESKELISVKHEIASLRNEIATIKDMTIGLRQAINPEKPEEILTIVRLTDRLSAITERLETLDMRQKREIDAFKNSVIRELDAADRSTTTILVLLVPLIINFLYQLWKDRKESASAK